MIKYSLICEHEHEFEAWFSSSADYDRQDKGGLLLCPLCESTHVKKAIMAPSIKTTKGQDRPDASRLFEAFAREMRQHIKDTHTYVGEDFTRTARAMHEGEEPEKQIYGKASLKEAEALAEEGIPVSPLPAALAPIPDEDLN